MKDEIGPLQLMVVAFDSPDFTGKIADEFLALAATDLIKVVDAVVVAKDPNGELTVLEVSGLNDEEFSKYGAYIGALFGIGTGDEMLAEKIAAASAERFQERYLYGLTGDDLDEIDKVIPKNGAALAILIDHRWAIPLRNAMREAGGLLLAQDFLSPELLIGLGSEIYEEATTKA